MSFIGYMIPIGFMVAFTIGYFAVKYKWKIAEFF
jgi:hypothetical protein